MTRTEANASLDSALLVEDAWREQYLAARQRYDAAPAGERSTARTLLRHAGDQLRAASAAVERAEQLLHAQRPTRQQELAL